MANIKKDSTIPTVSITKQRKKPFGYGVNIKDDIMYINYDVIALDSNNNELYYIASNQTIEIPQSRWSEPLIQAVITALKPMVENEL